MVHETALNVKQVWPVGSAASLRDRPRRTNCHLNMSCFFPDCNDIDAAAADWLPLQCKALSALISTSVVTCTRSADQPTAHQYASCAQQLQHRWSPCFQHLKQQQQVWVMHYAKHVLRISALQLPIGCCQHCQAMSLYLQSCSTCETMQCQTLPDSMDAIEHSKCQHKQDMLHHNHVSVLVTMQTR